MEAQGVERKLAAVLSADVAGYSRLMGSDEEATLKTLTEYRTAMQKLGALGTRPPEYEEVAKELATASQTLNKEIEDQKYTILMAQKSGDKERAKWELTKLLRLVPDKNHPVHIKAKSDLKWYP